MILLREPTRTVYDLPVGSAVLFAASMAATIHLLPLTFKHVAFVVADLAFLFTMIVQFRVTSRVGDELVTLSCVGRKRWPARRHRLRGRTSSTSRGTKYHDLELVPGQQTEAHEALATIATVYATARGRAKLEAAAQLLDMPVSW
ncbi:hypothetical protein LZC95_45965 [Pendulispora brunnea]|uniref:Uncharacterized protein n=1 Tax=Pendulispora brunnea TaxID=2905690 RepID=A0ABZ2KAB0_9BACT